MEHERKYLTMDDLEDDYDYIDENNEELFIKENEEEIKELIKENTEEDIKDVIEEDNINIVKEVKVIIEDEEEISEEYKDKIFKQNKNILSLIYYIFEGNIFKTDLQALCLKYKAVKNVSEFERRLNDMTNALLIEFDYIKKSKLHCIHIKSYATLKMDNNKDIKSINTSRMIDSHFKAQSILKNEYLDYMHPRLNLYCDLDSTDNLVNYLINETTLDTTEQSTVIHYKKLEKWYKITDESRNTIDRARYNNFNRDKKIIKDKEEIERRRVEIADAIYKVETEYTEKEKHLWQGFGTLRDRKAFLYRDSFTALENETKGIQINFFKTIKDSQPGAKNIVDNISNAVIFSLKHLEDVRDIDIKIYFREKKNVNITFEELTKNISVKLGFEERIYLEKRLNDYLSSKFSVRLTNPEFFVDSDNSVIDLKLTYEYNKKVGGILDYIKEPIFIKVQLISLDINNNIYQKNVEEALNESATERNRKSKELKKYKESSSNKIAKLDSMKRLDNALYLSKFATSKLKRLNDILNLADEEFERLMDFARNL